MTPNDAPEEYADDEIDLFQIWARLVENKWIVITTTLLGLLVATALAFIMTPKYEAKLVASSAEESKSSGGIGALGGQLGGLAELAGVSLGGGGNKDAALAYLKSRVFIEGFIKENGLMEILYAKQWDATNKKWLVDDPKKIPTSWKAYRQFSNNILDVQQEKKTGLITLTITWKNRDQAVEWANSLIKRANENLRNRSISDTEKSLSYLEKELQKTSIVEVQNTIFRVMESQIKTMMMANTQEQFAFKVIDPAMAVDEDAFVKPKRPLIIATGGIGGLFLGILLVFIRQALRTRRERMA